MGKIKVNETASEPIDMKKSGSDKEILGLLGRELWMRKECEEASEGWGVVLRRARRLKLGWGLGRRLWLWLAGLRLARR